MVSQLFLFTVLLFSGEEGDDELRFQFHRLMHDQRLSGENVRSVFQDNYGFIWLGIDSEGLCKYDGSEMEVFGHVGSDSTTISSNYINDISEDRYGNLWLATDKGLNVFDRHKRTFTRVKLPDASASLCNTIFRDRKNDLWVGTDRGLYHFYKSSKTSADFDSVRIVLPGVYVKRMIQAQDDSYWVGSKSGLYSLSASGKKVGHWDTSSGAHPLSDNEINSLLQIDNSYFLIATDNGVNLFDRGKNRFWRLEFHESGVFNAAKVGIVDILRDTQGVVWIGTSSYGVLTGAASVEGIDTMPVSFTLPAEVTGISSKNITSFFEDATGQVWVSTKFGGVSIHDRRSQLFPRYSLPVNPDQHEAGDNHILSALEDKAGNFWFGTRNRGLLKFDPVRETHEEVIVYQDQDLEVVRRIEVIANSSDGRIWIGHKKGINWLEPESGQQHYQELPKVFSIVKDVDENLWIGTIQGIFFKSKDSHQVQRYSESNQPLFANETLEMDQIFCDSKGTIWFGTNDQGVFRYFPSGDSLKQFIADGSAGSISGNTIRSIYEDATGSIWVGTKSSGLNFFDGSRFTHLGKDDGLPSNSIFAILEDADQMLWLVTNNGISRYSGLKGTFENFNKSHGLQSNVFEKKACLKTRRGAFLLAGNNGYNLFDPDGIALDDVVPGVVITTILADGDQLARDVSERARFEVQYDQNMISLEFSSFDFRDQNAIEYAYRLGGVDDSWIHTGNQNSVTYTNLAPGTYAFQVKATNADGIWSDTPLEVTFVVGKPFWLEWWAYFIYAVGVGLLGCLIYYIATVRARYYHQLQTTEVELHRTQELHRMKLNFFTNISHELRTPLTLVMATFEKLMKSQSGQNIGMTLKNGYRSAKQLLNLADQLLYFRRIEHGNLPLVVKPGDMQKQICELAASFEELAAKEGIPLRIIANAGIRNTWYDEDKVEKIVSNLLSNAFKYTERGEITISYSCSSSSVPSAEDIFPEDYDYAQISVKDSGRGMTEEQLKHIFDRYYQTDIINTGGGIGLDLVKRLVKLHKGHLFVKSKPGEGSVFTIYLPVSRNAYSESEIASGLNRRVSSPPEWLVDQPLTIEEPVYMLENDLPVTWEGERHKLLVVEDNQQLATFLQEALRSEYFITICRSGGEALDKAKLFRPDIIISDVMMPGMSGTELCRRLKKSLDTSQIPVVLLTAKVLEEYQREGYECGADAYVTKPFHIDILSSQLRSIIRNRKAIRASTREISLDVGKPGNDHGFISRVDEIIGDNYSNADFSVDEFAHDLHMSRSQLFRKVKGLTDQTPSEYLYAYRIQRAIELLQVGEQTIAEIAYATGFRSPNSFTKTFTKHVGVSPSKFSSHLSYSKK